MGPVITRLRVPCCPERPSRRPHAHSCSAGLSPVSPPVGPSFRAFAASSFWNAPLAANAPLDGQSATYVADLQRQVAQYGPWINTTEYSSAVYTVAAGQPTVHVTLDNNAPGLQAALDQVPIPAGAQPAAGTDGTMIITQPSTDTMWELWRAVRRADGWHATYGGRMSNVSSNPGYFTDPPSWGATATSLPMLGGLMRIDELAAGHIDHALALALPETRAIAYSFPAQRTHGAIDRATAIPQGARFRLDLNLDLNQIPMDPIVKEMAIAAQRYGIVVRDTAGSVAFYGEDPTPTGTDPYGAPGGFFHQAYPSQLLAQFPWSHLQTLQTNLSYTPK